APRLYLASDVDPSRNRGGNTSICAEATITFVNPGDHSSAQALSVTLTRDQSAARNGTVSTANGTGAIPADGNGHVFAVTVPPGTSTIKITAVTPRVRCASTPLGALPEVSARLQPASAPPGR